ncbi:hypothetical protein [Williamsia sp. M5A3_1d]
MTDISAAQGCSEAPAAGKRALHVALSASLTPATTDENFSAASTLLLTQNWSVVGSDGFTSTDLDIDTSCDFDAGPFYQAMMAGTKQRGDIVFQVPADATTLALGGPAVRRGWTWTIPAA